MEMMITVVFQRHGLDQPRNRGGKVGGLGKRNESLREEANGSPVGTALLPVLSNNSGEENQKRGSQNGRNGGVSSGILDAAYLVQPSAQYPRRRES